MKETDFLLNSIELVKNQAIFGLNIEGKISHWNPGAEQLTGYDSQEALGRSIVYFLECEESPTIYIENLLDIAKTKGFFKKDLMFLHKKGNKFCANIEIIAPSANSNELSDFIVVARDLTQYKEALSILNRNGEQTKVYLDNMFQPGIWQWVIPENKIIWDNHIHILHGVEVSKFTLTFEDFIEVIHPEDQELVRNKIKSALEEGEQFEIEYRVTKSNCSVCYLSTKAYIYRDSKNIPNFLSGITWDITEHKNNTLKCVSTGERPITIDTQTSYKNLLDNMGVVCHEIRNTLNGINGGIELQESFLKKLTSKSEQPLNINAEFEKFLTEIKDITVILKENALQQRVIIDDMLDLSKLESGNITINKTAFNPKEIIDEVIHMLSPQIIKNNVTILKEMTCKDFSVAGDAKKLSQVFNNLLSNAIKFTHNGRITIRLTYNEINDSNEVMLSFAIEDTGIGISKEDLPTLFQPFMQANNSISTLYGGTGLGLSISKRFIELMGGTINVYSERGRGSQFTFNVRCQNFQLEPKHEEIKDKGEISNIEDSLTPKDILIVEDNPINRKILEKQLMEKNHRCKYANNGKEAVDLCKAFSFQVILMDVWMPVMDGLQATKEIRKIEQMKQRIPAFIIGLSGNNDPKQAGLAMDFGMNDFLTKPYQFQDIHLKCVQAQNIERMHMLKRKYKDEGMTPSCSNKRELRFLNSTKPTQFQTQLLLKDMHTDLGNDQVSVENPINNNQEQKEKNIFMF